MTELSRLRGSEGYAACDDETEGLEGEVRTGVHVYVGSVHRPQPLRPRCARPAPLAGEPIPRRVHFDST